jgi:hypothetical protein
VAASYLSELRGIVAGCVARQQFESVVCKHFFSGAAAYVDGRIFATLTPVGLAIKLGDASCQTLLGQGAIPLRYFPSAPIKRGYVLFEDVGRVDADRLAALFAESIANVLAP